MSENQSQTDPSVTQDQDQTKTPVPSTEQVLPQCVEVHARVLPELKGSYVIAVDGTNYTLDRQLLVDPEGHKQIPCGTDGQKIAYIKRCSGTFITKDGRGVRCHNNFFQLPKSYKSYCPLCNDTDHPERREFNESQKHIQSDERGNARGRGRGRGRGLGHNSKSSARNEHTIAE